MPQVDKTGPRGMGPMTGRGMGFCGGNEQRRYNGGRRRGFRNMFHMTGLPGWMRVHTDMPSDSTAGNKFETLRSRVDYLILQNESIAKRIEMLEKNNSQ